MRYEARAPLRIDFGGGWTDVDLYAREHGGAVLNAAISRYADGYIARPGGLLSRLRGQENGLRYGVDAPPGSGLGTSAAQTVVWATLVRTMVANTASRKDIAEIACQIQRSLGIMGGRQDEYASALGGINYIQFSSTVEIERLELGSFASELRSRLVLVYSGASRLSSTIHEQVWERYREGDLAVKDNLARLRALAGDMRNALVEHDLDGFGRLLREHWETQQKLHPAIGEGVAQVVGLGEKHGALGGKACGAGGGGAVIFLTRAGQEETLRTAMRRNGFQIIDFEFDTFGVHLRKG